ncbi:dihydroneopterin aldolase family protein [Archaeoglobus veneficus]|uniref:Dihydroneopterin aldolase n=1 Tax=Archaeoglobus veneficus (strain DSM 11195 / SNP6) TaxID=693661 RepID=F2KPK2_ARCVS|nr:dihydroneopterin aldolase family protein [Archaeoglobus veneficus]AEA46433.1 protein of unknown function DUF381 [Archaeoglobus veneficus SNP6]
MSEKAAFEAGIKLAALFHQFIGAPVSPENAELLERAMESCMRLQPYVVEAEVRINRKKLEKALSSYGYTSLTPEMLYAKVSVEVEGERAVAVMEWDEEKNYPLMRLL